MMTLLTVLKFIERTQSIYNECLTEEELSQGITGENIFMQNIVFMSQNSPKTVKNDGFPLIMVLLSIAETCLNLVKEEPFKPKN